MDNDTFEKNNLFFFFLKHTRLCSLDLFPIILTQQTQEPTSTVLRFFLFCKQNVGPLTLRLILYTVLTKKFHKHKSRDEGLHNSNVLTVPPHRTVLPHKVCFMLKKRAPTCICSVCTDEGSTARKSDKKIAQNQSRGTIHIIIIS